MQRNQMYDDKVRCPNNRWFWTGCNLERIVKVINVNKQTKNNLKLNLTI